MTKHVMPNLKGLPFGGASNVINPSLTKLVYQYIVECCDSNVLDDLTIENQFLDQYQLWIRDTKLNNLSGLDNFTVAAFSNGTTESFDKFYLKNHKRRFRCFKGEYMYHPASWKTAFPEWVYLEDQPLEKNDAVIMSMPFSDTGNVHPQSAKLLNQANNLGVPVLIDSAFFGICQNINFDYNHPAITDITFSLSKSFPVANLRIGMRLTRYDDDDSLLVHHKTNYNNRLACGVGLKLLQNFSPDYNTIEYQTKQDFFCKQLGVEPSNSVIFGLGNQQFQEYNRGGVTNRLSFAKYLYQGNLPND